VVYWPTTSNSLPEAPACWSTIAVSVIATSIWPACSAVNIEGVSGNTLAGVDGFNCWSTKSAPVVACCTPMRSDFILPLSTAVPFLARMPMSEAK